TVHRKQDPSRKEAGGWLDVRAAELRVNRYSALWTSTNKPTPTEKAACRHRDSCGAVHSSPDPEQTFGCSGPMIGWQRLVYLLPRCRFPGPRGRAPDFLALATSVRAGYHNCDLLAVEPQESHTMHPCMLCRESYSRGHFNHCTQP